MSRRRHLGLALAAVLALAGCGEREPAKPATPPPERLELTAVGFAALPGWRADEVGAALTPLRRSCERLMRQADDRPVGPDAVAGTVADWRPACAALAAAATPDAVRTVVEAQFEPFRASGRDGPEGLFTGYYEPELRGARARGAGFAVPLLKRPDDLVMVELGDFRADWRGERIAGRVVDGALKPYPDRAAIERGALAGRNLELLWVDDPIDAFFLQIQGSGRVALPDGRTVRVGYAGQNGHPYVAIGRELVQRGALARDQVSMRTIREWLVRHPAEAPDVMARNPSYVFFKEIAGDGPIGAQGLVLTPGRSVAVDPKFLPLGIPLWLDVDLPGEPGGRLQRLVVAQDTGGAIRGPVRADVFWGTGAAAGERAGAMQQRGGYWLLLPKAAAEKRKRVS